MRAEGEGTVESTQEKMEGHPFFSGRKKKIVDAGISGNSKKNIEKQSLPGRSGGKADHLWALGRAGERLFLWKQALRTAA